MWALEFNCNPGTHTADKVRKRAAVTKDKEYAKSKLYSAGNSSRSRIIQLRNSFACSVCCAAHVSQLGNTTQQTRIYSVDDGHLQIAPSPVFQRLVSSSNASIHSQSRPIIPSFSFQHSARIAKMVADSRQTIILSDHLISEAGFRKGGKSHDSTKSAFVKFRI